MTQQVRLNERARADAGAGMDGTHEIAPDLSYLRCLIVNVVFVGRPDAGVRGWVLVDTGVIGSGAAIKAAAAARFGADARPAAILLTHGHFDHVGALEDLAAAWDVPVVAHELEHSYLDGSAAYPPGVGGGGRAMSALSRVMPRTTDWMGAHVISSLQIGKAVTKENEGTLFGPGRGGAVRGSSPYHVMRSAYTRARFHPLAIGAVVACLGLATTSLLRGKAPPRKH